MKPRTIYIDVDDTLVRSVGAKRVPMPGVVAAVRALHAQGALLYLWSSGGADYARQSAAELALSDCFIAFLPKPDSYIDDQSVDEWRYCRHVLPSNAADA
ncbi:hydrolase [Ottowia testudinis]|uniref:Hydrolase n=1 Tax=Ottowia testudinis TaxID=2816950 RepID=A0A975CLY6_9BURK|nr:hydrolase [Ottowia testudinis]QTD45928.1 hydrolase [Ottowia testudinis]